MLKLLAGAVLVSPYLPMLFMGEEYGELQPFQYFVSHSDPVLVEAVRKGRKEEFAAFQSLGEAPDPQDEETFHRSRLNWDLINSPSNKTLFSFYKALIQLRKSTSPLRHLNRKNIDIKCNADAKTIFLHRWHQQEHVFIFFNFSKEIQISDVPKSISELKLIFNSASSAWGGPQTTSSGNSQGNKIKIQAESFLIYYSNHV